METKEFIQNYREAFGSKAPLPLLFGYSDKPIAQTEKIGGCFFKGLQAARDGQPVSLSVDVIGCGGGKLYTGFDDISTRSQVSAHSTQIGCKNSLIERTAFSHRKNGSFLSKERLFLIVKAAQSF